MQLNSAHRFLYFLLLIKTGYNFPVAQFTSFVMGWDTRDVIYFTRPHLILKIKKKCSNYSIMAIISMNNYTIR